MPKTDPTIRALETLARQAACDTSSPPFDLDRAVHLRRPTGLQGRYDIAQTSFENQNHWANADLLSADAANSAAVRQILRSRSRYEVANNSFAHGIVRTLADDLIGAGPVLQLNIDVADTANTIENHWRQWAAAVNLAGKLRTMALARATDGEVFALLTSRDHLATPVQLDLQIIEADRIASPPESLLADDVVDGIRIDHHNEPAAYCLLKVHPGSSGLTVAPAAEYTWIDAPQVIHWFRADRPEQHRGIPLLVPALPILAILRRWTLATVEAAESAANIAMVMHTDAPPEAEAAEVDPWVTMALARNSAIFAPEGWQPSQMKSEHPNHEYSAFRNALINEAARCVSMPRNIASCDSSGYNYASGRLDHQVYDRSTAVDRAEAEHDILDPLLAAFLRELLLLPGLGLARQLDRVYWPHAWHWDTRRRVDPAREAMATERLFLRGLLTESEYWAESGRDWEEAMAQKAREEQRRTDLGLPTLADMVRPNRSTR